MEIAALDYQLRKEEVEKDIQRVLGEIVENIPTGTWVSQFSVNDITYERVLIDEKGVFLFCQFEKELTDPALWEELKWAQELFLECVTGLEEEKLTVYALLNGPITQKAHFGLFQPKTEFLTPVVDLTETFLADFEQRQKILSGEEIEEYLSFFEEETEEVSEREDLYSDATGNYILVRGKWKRRSDIDPEMYFSLALFGGAFGLHKFYARCYGSFLVYLFTLGFFGFGWVYDLFEICLGIAKDRRKAYIGPFEEKNEKRVWALIVGAIYVVVMIVFFVLF